jgi:phage repressor protein C with HTH and peptisase S24 domain
MARRKTLPESVRAKLALAERLGALRLELFGDRGGPEMARRLAIPVRTWYNYEGGVTVPAEVVLKIIELTSVEPAWLLHGKGPKFRHTGSSRHDAASPPAMTVGALLRTALQILESEGSPDSGSANDESLAATVAVDGAAGSASASARTAVSDRDNPSESSDADFPAPERGSHVRQEWLAAQRENRFIRVSGDAMAPILADGASVAYSPREEDVSQLHRKMVVVWLDGNPMVRWFEHCGRYALLKAENPSVVPSEILVDLEESRDSLRFRRVLWINSPH